MKDLPEQPGVPAFVLLRQVVDDDSVGYEAVYVRIKVLTEAGRKYGDIEIPLGATFSTSPISCPDHSPRPYHCGVCAASSSGLDSSHFP
jgi:hypothetical protein